MQLLPAFAGHFSEVLAPHHLRGQVLFFPEELHRVEHLLLTRDMTFNDLANDLAMLAADLEM